MIHSNTPQDIQTVLAVMKPVLAAMLDAPETLNVVPLPTSSGTVLRVSCHPADVSKLIGKGGRNARALRTVLLAVSRQSALDLDIVMPTSSSRENKVIETLQPALV